MLHTPKNVLRPTNTYSPSIIEYFLSPTDKYPPSKRKCSYPPNKYPPFPPKKNFLTPTNNYPPNVRSLTY